MAEVTGLKKVFGLTRENIPLWGASIGHGYVHWFPSTFFLLLPLIKKEAPVLGGWIADRWGLMYTFYFLAATVLVSNVLVIFVRDARDLGAVEQGARRKG
jgi:hypothetical protein